MQVTEVNPNSMSEAKRPRREAVASFRRVGPGHGRHLRHRDVLSSFRDNSFCEEVFSHRRSYPNVPPGEGVSRRLPGVVAAVLRLSRHLKEKKNFLSEARRRGQTHVFLQTRAKIHIKSNNREKQPEKICRPAKVVVIVYSPKVFASRSFHSSESAACPHTLMCSCPERLGSLA